MTDTPRTDAIVHGSGTLKLLGAKHYSQPIEDLISLARTLERENERLAALVVQGLCVVNDFLPNIGNCVLQDYGRLNEFCIEAGKIGDAQAK